MGEKKIESYKWSSWNDLLGLRSFVVIDIETTGFDDKKDRIIEIGLIKVVEGEEKETFSSFVNPGTAIPAHITRLTGITNDDVAEAPSFQELATQILEFIGDAVIIAHNAPFDLRFLTAELACCDVFKKFVYLDTLQIVKKAFPYLESYRLTHLASSLCYINTQTHRALDDTRLALAVHQAVLFRLRND